ncbi:MAG: DUF2098 family protein [Candidatus Methanomethylicaceae archaeon]
MLREGAAVIYKRTGTLGRVVELREMDGKVWAKLDSTGLFYDEDFLETVEENFVKEPKQEMEKEVEQEKIKEVEKEKSETPEIRDEGKIDTSGNVCGAG